MPRWEYFRCAQCNEPIGIMPAGWLSYAHIVCLDCGDVRSEVLMATGISPAAIQTERVGRVRKKHAFAAQYVRNLFHPNED